MLSHVIEQRCCWVTVRVDLLQPRGIPLFRTCIKNLSFLPGLPGILLTHQGLGGGLKEQD